MPAPFGEPGLARSGVLSALCDRLEAQCLRALRFQLSPYDVFWPSIDNLEWAAEVHPGGRPETQRDAVRPMLRCFGRTVASVLEAGCDIIDPRTQDGEVSANA